MINPNIEKLVLVTVEAVTGTQQFADYRGRRIEINDYRHGFAKPGKRRLWLRYSIMSDRYYLSVK